MKQITTIKGRIIDVINRRIYGGIIDISGGRIKSITPADINEGPYIMPGFTDAHIHIESSMLIPSAFAQLAVIHGTTACVSDPHEIANVMGTDGVHFMINNGKKVPFNFYFGAPSCVPATDFETSGAVIDSTATEALLAMPEIYYLAEMMNFPGVIFEDKEVMLKLAAARKHGKVIDGHAPGLSGENLVKYAKAGISTDHECFTIEEAEAKIILGMKVLIREGSAAKNFDELLPLITKHPEDIMLCSDDKHPDDLIKGHINLLIKSALAKGYELFNVLRTVSLNPTRHYGLEQALLQKDDKADFIVVDDLKNLNILETYIGGILVASHGQSHIPTVDEKPVNMFNASPLKVEDISLKPLTPTIRVIEAIDGQLITKSTMVDAPVQDNFVVSSTERDILKIVVLQRYRPSKPAVAFIRGFGLNMGAMASTIAHDSHNIIAVGTSDEEIVKAINALIDYKGGIVAVNGEEITGLPLPYGGLMSDISALELAKQYETIDSVVKSYGSPLIAPFMTLAFMALLVIPDLKLSDKGLFDGTKFEFTDVFVK